MPRILQTHISQIKVAQTKLGMLDADYRALLVRAAGVDSSKKLTMEGFASVMAEFNRLGFESTAQAEKRKQLDRAPGHVSYAQRLKIQSLWDQWKGKSDKVGLERWLKKKWDIDNPKFMSSELAAKAIGALENFKKGDSHD